MPFRRRPLRPASDPPSGPRPARVRSRAWPWVCLRAACLWTACLWTLGLGALTPGAAPAAEGGIPSLTDIRDETARLLEAGAELQVAAVRRALDADRAEARLAAEEVTLRARDVRTDMLRGARLEQHAARQRIDTLVAQAARQRAALDRLEQAIAVLAETPVPAADTDLAGPRRAAALRLLRGQADATRTLADALDGLVAAGRRLLVLNGERLRLLQSRARLDALDDVTNPSGGLPDLERHVAGLEAAVTDSLRKASRLANELGDIDSEDPQAVARRQDLETRLQDAATRAYLAQNALELDDYRRRLAGFGALREDLSMPVPLLEDAAERLRTIAEGLRTARAELQRQRQMLATRGGQTGGRAAGSAASGATASATAGTGATGPAAAIGTAPGADLGPEIARQAQVVEDLIRQADQEATGFAATAAQVFTQSLTDRQAFPGTAGEWRRIAAGALGLPRLLVHELRYTWQDIRTRAGLLESAQWLVLIGAALLIATGALWVRRLLRRRLVNPDPGRHLAIPAAAFAAVLPLTIPALVWAWVGSRIDLPRPEFLPIVLLLALVPLSVFVLRLARANLFGPDPEATGAPVRARYYRRLRGGLLLAALVGALYLVARSLPISPPLGDILDRLAMLGLLLLAVPAFGLHALIRRYRARAPGSADAPAEEPAPPLASPGQWPMPLEAPPPAPRPPGLPPGPRPVRLGIRLLGELSRLIGLALVAAGVLGLAGYANLAWAISSRIAWLGLVAMALYLAIGALGDLRDLAWRRTAGERGEFWQRQVLLPAYGLAVLAAWLIAGWALLRLWGWSSETPLVRTLLDWAGRPLVATGNLNLTPWHLAVSVLLVAVAVASGAWIRRVSFQLAYAGVRDRGLRQTLATFTQYLVIVAGVLVALKVSGLDLTTLLVFVASLGVGIGFGLQNIVNNFISGILLLVERPLRLGDVVTVGGHEGEVTHIGIRSLTMRTFDKQEVIIPNGTVISGDFINWTRSDDILRTVLTVGIGYQDDPDAAMALIAEILSGYPPVLREPPPRVSLWEFGDSAVVLRIEYCIHFQGPVGRTAVRSEVNRRIWYGFQEAGISMPFPQRDLHVRMLPGATGGEENLVREKRE